MSEVWRLLVDAGAAGPWNMGVDEALLASASRGGPPTLRLYTWSGPWLSLGYAQRLAPATTEACRAAGVGVVRRATGGGAVLHGADLTYAVAAPEALLPGGLQGSYARLSRGLERALGRLGIAVTAGDPPPEATEARPFDCFAVAAAHELCVGGRKLVGSAQRRGQGAVLQHGSLRLRPDPEAARSAAGLAGSGATSLAELGCPAAPEEARGALLEGLGAALDARWEAGELAAAEAEAAATRGFSPRSGREPSTGLSSRGLSAGR
ncbi:MAG: octanoyltransferase [Myxococcota bacterium]|nr:octanoyltransferase [Myxococcota bacterium]